MRNQNLKERESVCDGERECEQGRVERLYPNRVIMLAKYIERQLKFAYQMMCNVYFQLMIIAACCLC